MSIYFILISSGCGLPARAYVCVDGCEVGEKVRVREKGGGGCVLRFTLHGSFYLARSNSQHACSPPRALHLNLTCCHLWTTFLWPTEILGAFSFLFFSSPQRHAPSRLVGEREHRSGSGSGDPADRVARQVGQKNGLLAVGDRLCCGSGERLAVSLHLLPKRRR